MMKNNEDIFGSVKMGYALIESNKLKEWQVFCEEGLGMHLAEQSDNELAFRIDDHARRLIVRKGSSEDFVSVGWQVKDEETLNIILGRLAARNIKVEQGSEKDSEVRGVDSFWVFKGPKGLLVELFIEAKICKSPLNMLTSGFYTDDSGMGHVAITSKKPGEMLSFWKELFDARQSDTIEEQISGLTLNVTFLRLNERHHSLAVAAVKGVKMDPIRTKIQHMNLQAVDIGDLSDAYRRCRKLGYRIANAIGEHPNDRELSFYVRTPSGFDIELGWNPLKVNEDEWQQAHYKGISLWGHKPIDMTPLDKIKEIFTGVKSLMHTEYSPFEQES